MTHSVTEGDLLDVLKMHGAQKLLRQILTSLKKDKLIKTYCSQPYLHNRILTYLDNRI